MDLKTRQLALVRVSVPLLGNWVPRSFHASASCSSSNSSVEPLGERARAVLTTLKKHGWLLHGPSDNVLPPALGCFPALSLITVAKRLSCEDSKHFSAFSLSQEQPLLLIALMTLLVGHLVRC